MKEGEPAMNKDKAPLREWWELLNETQKKRTSKGMLKMINQGPNKYGFPLADPEETESAAPGAPGGGSIGHGGLEEDVEPESFEVHDTLESQIWLDDDQLLPDVRERLLQIAFDFVDAMEIQATPVDIRLTGSLANYNWSKYSDIDLHIVIDFKNLDSDPEMVKKFFDAYRLRWNDKHYITIYGYEVEIYVENVDETHHSSGIYSILHEKWIEIPNPDDAQNGWSESARKKSDDIMTQINLIQHILPRKPKAALRSIERLKKKISNMRTRGLESSAQESSEGNIAFKILRREQALKKLSDLKTQAYDNAFTLGK
jgi:hypothetical protein